MPQTKVVVSRFVEKQLRKLPSHIKIAFMIWTDSVEVLGLAEVRKSRGYHDEPLMGERRGQRSVRLSRAYRVFYIESIEGLEIMVIEVNKHEY